MAEPITISICAIMGMAATIKVFVRYATKQIQ